MNALPMKPMPAGSSGRRHRIAHAPPRSTLFWLRRNLTTVLTVLATAFVLGGLVRLATDRHVARVVSFQEP